ncbi:hypothetical protein DFH09DRAFT_1076915 [Mycena vulgaris]|nr:hypothetical protein DFH09DRAFT_1076915 [Mycena vulgaris]
MDRNTVWHNEWRGVGMSEKLQRGRRVGSVSEAGRVLSSGSLPRQAAIDVCAAERFRHLRQGDRRPHEPAAPLLGRECQHGLEELQNGRGGAVDVVPEVRDQKPGETAAVMRGALAPRCAVSAHMERMFRTVEMRQDVCGGQIHTQLRWESGQTDFSATTLRRRHLPALGARILVNDNFVRLGQRCPLAAQPFTNNRNISDPRWLARGPAVAAKRLAEEHRHGVRADTSRGHDRHSSYQGAVLHARRRFFVRRRSLHNMSLQIKGPGNELPSLKGDAVRMGEREP